MSEKGEGKRKKKRVKIGKRVYNIPYGKTVKDLAHYITVNVHPVKKRGEKKKNIYVSPLKQPTTIKVEWPQEISNDLFRFFIDRFGYRHLANNAHIQQPPEQHALPPPENQQLPHLLQPKSPVSKRFVPIHQPLGSLRDYRALSPRRPPGLRVGDTPRERKDERESTRVLRTDESLRFGNARVVLQSGTHSEIPSTRVATPRSRTTSQLLRDIEGTPSSGRTPSPVVREREKEEREMARTEEDEQRIIDEMDQARDRSGVPMGGLARDTLDIYRRSTDEIKRRANEIVAESVRNDPHGANMPYSRALKQAEHEIRPSPDEVEYLGDLFKDFSLSSPVPSTQEEEDERRKQTDSIRAYHRAYADWQRLGKPPGKEPKRSEFGRGKGTLYDNQIDELGFHLLPKEFAGTYARDEIYKVPVSKNHVTSFIFNSDPHTRGGRHWMAARIDPTQQSIEVFDSFGRPMGRDIIAQLRDLVRSVSEKPLKYHQNKVDVQRENGSNCGWFSLKFLKDRHDGIPWTTASNFHGILESERNIERFKKKMNKFIHV